MGAAAGERPVKSVSLDICNLEPGQQGELARFLSSAFGVPADSPFLSPELLAWKYFLPRPDWNGARSLAAIEDGRIVAHAGIWPLAFTVSGQPVGCLHLIDWGAVGVPGAGVLLYREVMRCAPAAIVVGGAAGARKMLPRMGFREAGRVSSYVRVVRPWRQFRLRTGGPRWKQAAKWARNTAWSMAAAAGHGDWTAEEHPRFPAELAPLLERHEEAGLTPGRRTVESLNFLLLCPGANCRAQLLRHRGELRGYFLLCRLGNQSRIADLRVFGSAADWAAAYSLAARAAARDPETCEIAAASSLELTSNALEENGFRVCGERPLWVCDRERMLAGAPPLMVQAIESDAFFLYDPENPFAS